MRTASESFVRFLNKYSKVARTAFDFAGERLFPAEIHTLSFIEGRGSSYVSEIARDTGVTRGAASQMTSNLLKKDLLSGEKDPENRSRTLLRLTAKGKAAAAAHTEHHEIRDKTFLAFLDSLSADQLRLVRRLFHEMDCWMDNYSSPPG